MMSITGVFFIMGELLNASSSFVFDFGKVS